ncbi:MAG TPA: DUF4112 domain-containing protein [Kofleriaceae bacterium]|nr:DUF4112 domain-containing protein [Kofleriaceae bacterium]
MPRSPRFATWPGGTRTVEPHVDPSVVQRTATHREPDLERVRTLTRVLDHYLVDPILGLVLPGAGDLIGSLLGLYVVGLAVRRRSSPVIIARMLLNLALDAGLGFVPIVGDIADFAFKANAKNLALLSERPAGGKATARDWLVVGGAALVFVAVIALVIYGIVALIRAIS